MKQEQVVTPETPGNSEVRSLDDTRQLISGMPQSNLA